MDIFIVHSVKMKTRSQCKHFHPNEMVWTILETAFLITHIQVNSSTKSMAGQKYLTSQEKALIFAIAIQNGLTRFLFSEFVKV